MLRSVVREIGRAALIMRVRGLQWTILGVYIRPAVCRSHKIEGLRLQFDSLGGSFIGTLSDVPHGSNAAGGTQRAGKAR